MWDTERKKTTPTKTVREYQTVTISQLGNGQFNRSLVCVFDKRVNKLIEEGWEPYGPPYSLGNRSYVQAMVKFSVVEDKDPEEPQSTGMIVSENLLGHRRADHRW